jgi:Ser/Thr protein kinase RdoA (MazF antagonist)
VPVVEPLTLENGATLDMIDNQIYFAVFPKAAGRAPQELTHDQLRELGRFVGRIHNVGAQRKDVPRMKLTPETYGRAPLKFIIDGGFIPLELQKPYQEICDKILDVITPWFSDVPVHRIHGDCHMGNLLYNKTPFFLDFDDMLMGPAAQDIWLLTPGNDQTAQNERDLFLSGYCEMREFDRSTLRLVEPLRALRFIHYSAWIAKRWKDPAFPRAFPEFESHKYWGNEIQDLQKQFQSITG